MTAVNLYQKSVYKDKEKRYRVFNIKVSDSNDDDFFSESNKKEKVSNEIAALFKKTVSKMFKFKWVADSEFFLYITDQLQLFNDLLIWMRHQQIKVKREHLYSYYCEVIIMQVRLRNSVRLSSTLYVSELEVNLLSEKWMCKMKLHKSFDQHCL